MGWLSKLTIPIILFSLILNFYLFSILAVENHTVSPKARINQSDIHVFKDKIVIDIQNPDWGLIANTGSMRPTIDGGHYSIELKPNQSSDIQAGDIISFRHKDIIIIHRVQSIENDSQGIYFNTKGDNSDLYDDIKVRFADIKGVVVAIIY